MQGVAHCLHLCYLRPADRLHRQKHRHYLYQNNRRVRRYSEEIMGSPGIFNPWGERSCSEYLLLKRSFGTYTRSMPATEEYQGVKKR